MGHEPLHHFRPDRLGKGRIKAVGAGENAGAVNHIINAGWNAGGHTFLVLGRDDGFHQSLTLGQKPDELFINGVDFETQFRNANFFIFDVMVLELDRDRQKVNVSKRRVSAAGPLSGAVPAPQPKVGFRFSHAR
jgi:hypothetical protein